MCVRTGDPATWAQTQLDKPIFYAESPIVHLIAPSERAARSGHTQWRTAGNASERNSPDLQIRTAYLLSILHCYNELYTHGKDTVAK